MEGSLGESRFTRRRHQDTCAVRLEATRGTNAEGMRRKTKTSDESSTRVLVHLIDDYDRERESFYKYEYSYYRYSIVSLYPRAKKL